MKIDAGISPAYTGYGQKAPAASRNDATTFSDVLATANSPSKDATKVTLADFTSMTRQEIRDWANGQVRSGQMSLDNSFPFFAMTMKIPVGGQEVPVEGDSERIDFLQRTRQGIEGALSNNDAQAAKRLEIALSMMLHAQGKAIGIKNQA